MTPAVFDLECFYDPKNTRGDKKHDGSPDPYTLRSMTTESFVRDKRWDIHGAAIKWSASTSATWYDPRELAYVLKEQDWNDILLISHHANFDHLALSHHYGVVPKLSGCTMSMARLMLGNHIGVSLDSVRAQFGFSQKSTPYNLMEGRYWKDMDQYTRDQVAAGACDEVESIWKLFGILMQRGFPVEELDVLDSTIKMFTVPELVGDSRVFAKVWQDEAVRKQAMLDKLGVTAKDLGSDDVFASLLRARGIEPETKTTDKGNVKFAFANTDPFMEEIQQDEDEEVRALAEARLGNKSSLLQTRAETLGWMTSRGNGTLCVYLRYAGAHTSRWSGGDGCLTADTRVLVFDYQKGLTEKPIVDILADDLVWDGEEFVSHGGIAFRGYKEVIEHDGIRGTKNHIVFGIHGKEISLSEAHRLGTGIMDCPKPNSEKLAPAWKTKTDKKRR